MSRSPVDVQLTALAAWLRSRRERALRGWEEAVANDPELSAALGLSRRQLHDHVPNVVDGFIAGLRAGADRAESTAGKYGDRGADHGQHRWQQGYRLTEVMREWGHLQLCLLDQIEQYAAENPETDPAALRVARRLLTWMCNEVVKQSTLRFLELQQTEATASLQDLRRATEASRPLERDQAELLRGAAHDLRGNLGIVLASVTVLARDDLPRASREQLLALVKKSVASQQQLLDNLIGLTRLQAGQERRQVTEFDAARVLDELGATCRELAEARGLTLEVHGPHPLRVQGDPVRVRRIAQNLLLNALDYTESGGVEVSWGDCSIDPRRWMFSVADTGPGLARASNGPLAEVLDPTVEASEQGAPPRAAAVRGGEGIGLAIVKRLCELLEATLEVESHPGRGTVFRVTLPRRYPDAGPPAVGSPDGGTSSS